VQSQSLARRLTAEGLGTGLLLAAIVGSGIMGERLSGGNAALALFCNSTDRGHPHRADRRDGSGVRRAFQSACHARLPAAA
jgi:hypothetical protein